VFYFTAYFILLWVFPAAFNFISEVFIVKLLNSRTEVATSNLETRSQIAENYRAFELANVLAVFNGGSNYAQWFGQGWGSALKFGLETAGSHFSRIEAAFLHNGYAYYLMKTGIIGLLMYGCFLLHLAVRAISPKSWQALPEAKMQRNVLLACAARSL
jgi:hypothetical protein